MNAPQRARPVLICCLIMAMALPARAAQFVGEAGYSLPAGETRLDDVYFGGTMLRIEGRLDGSCAAAAQSVNISGPVTRNLFLAAQSIDVSGAAGGDLVALCATLNISGRVAGAVRAGAGTVYINGAVGQDLLVGCANMVVGKNSEVRGDIVAACRAIEIAGTVRGDVKVVSNDVVISGSIDGDVDATVADRLTITPEARIYGNLRYRSDRPLDIKNPDLVFGNIEHVRLPSADEIQDLRNLKPRPSLFVNFLLPFAILSVIGALVIGFLLIAIWKYVLNEGMNRAIRRWGRTLGFGAVGFLMGPMTILVALALVITIPAGLVAAAAYVILVYLGKTIAGMFAGKLLFRIFGAPDVSLWWAAPVGIVIVYALCAIPFVGWVFWLLSLAVGFGVFAELIGMSRTS